jgi:predicted Zn-dependent protease
MRGRFCDGRVALAHQVRVAIGERVLTIAAEDGTPLAHWPLAEIERDGPAFLCAGATWTIDDPEELARHLPRPPRRAEKPWRLVALLAAAPALIVLIWLAIPPLARWAARYVPMEAEVALGDSAHFQILKAWPACTGPVGGAALWSLTSRVNGSDQARPRRVMVIDSPMVNAITLPGGTVLILRGLVDKLDTPEQLAGVLAHEIGHVRRRDALAASVRAIGVGALAAIVVGDASGIVGTAAGSLLGFSYSRDDETKADRQALTLLRLADIDPVGMARTFEMLERIEGAQPDFLSSHPASSARAAAFLADRQAGRAYRPALSVAQWLALKDICRAGK